MNNQEKNTYVRQHILSALLELMHTQDFVSISVQALVDAAGVGRASFYRNFASKEDVLQQESVRLTNEWKTNFDHEHPDGTPGQDNLWLISLLDFYKDHAEFYLALYHAGLSHIMQEIVESDLVFNISVYTNDDNLIFYSLPEQHSQPDVEVILEKMEDVKRQQKTQKDYKEWKKQNQNNETNSD